MKCGANALINSRVQSRANESLRDILICVFKHAEPHFMRADLRSVGGADAPINSRVQSRAMSCCATY